MGKIFNYGVDKVEALNPGYTFVSNKGFTSLVHGFTSVGFRYYVKVQPIFLMFAIGYDFEYASIVGFSGAADTNKDLGHDSNFSILIMAFHLKFTFRVLKKNSHYLKPQKQEYKLLITRFLLNILTTIYRSLFLSEG